MLVTCARITHNMSEALDGFQILGEYLKSGVHDREHGISISVEIWRQGFNRCIWIQGANGSHASCVVGRAAIGKILSGEDDRVLVLAPKRLRDNWTLYKANNKRNILAADRFNYDVLTHTALSRHSGRARRSIGDSTFARPARKACLRAATSSKAGASAAALG